MMLESMSGHSMWALQIKKEKMLTFISVILLNFFVIFVVVDADLKNVSDLGVVDVALGPLLQLMNLLHLQMLHRPNVIHQKVFTRGTETAKDAVVGKLERRVADKHALTPLFVLALEEVIKQKRRDLMLL